MAAALGGCSDEPAAPTGLAAAKLQAATCGGWNEAAPKERQVVIDRLENAVAGPRGDGNTLSDDVAYTTLDARCKPEFAKGFLLYELYIRAAAFSSLAE
ncbi:MAG TPA: hypothetical protein VER75_07985 [Thermoleophilaceae bacterium]|nr:hypothetical protein [Thermoleophilaceae bacterium]